MPTKTRVAEIPRKGFDVIMSNIQSIMEEYLIKLVRYIWGSYISAKLIDEETDDACLEQLLKITEKCFSTENLRHLNIQIQRVVGEGHYPSRYPGLQLTFQLVKSVTVIVAIIDKEGELLELRRHDKQ